jgi:hypothetical protein
MVMWELWIYRRWMHILEWRYARQYFRLRLANNMGSPRALDLAHEFESELFIILLDSAQKNFG